jgi:1,4-dihydroxy-2-naphthoate octaprenyltransferase
MNKLKIHLIQLPRWFAAPFFGASILLGVVLAGGSFHSLKTWLVLVVGLFVMAGGHSFNSLLDYAWTGLDKGEVEDRSAEKGYTGGQNLLGKGLVSQKEVLFNALGWYVASAIVLFFIGLNDNDWLVFVWFAGCMATFWYSAAKLNWTHELALGTAVGPLAVLLGMFGVNPHPPVMAGIICSVPAAVVLSFIGLPFDEWPDAEQNLKKGAKSIAFMVWKYSEGKVEGLWWYCSSWVAFIMSYQVFLISTGYLKPMTGLAFIPLVGMTPALLLCKVNFQKAMLTIVPLGALYAILVLVGQAI